MELAESFLGVRRHTIDYRPFGLVASWRMCDLLRAFPDIWTNNATATLNALCDYIGDNGDIQPYYEVYFETKGYSPESYWGIPASLGPSPLMNMDIPTMMRTLEQLGSTSSNRSGTAMSEIPQHHYIGMINPYFESTPIRAIIPGEPNG